MPTAKPVLKVVVLGDGGAGKSCLLRRFVSGHYDEPALHTIGVEFLNHELVVNGEKYTLQIWDTAGQERFRSLRTPFYRGTDICLLSCALDDLPSFLSLPRWLEEFRRYADVPTDNAAFPFIVIGNKSDATPREVSGSQLSSWCQQQGIGLHLETSAKTNSNVREAFTLGVERWAALERRAERSLPAPDTLRLNRRSSRGSGGSGGCCSSEH